MQVFRLTRKKHSSILSGTGAAIKGARWNSIGVELIYTASNRSLAMAEVAVHLSLATLPDDYVMMTISVPDDISTSTIKDSKLPYNWNSFPYSASTQNIGDRFVFQNKYCVLRTPSAVTQGDYKLLLNPHHKEFSKIKILNVESFPFDKRIFK